MALYQRYRDATSRPCASPSLRQELVGRRDPWRVWEVKIGPLYFEKKSVGSLLQEGVSLG
jgi:hypothetical protein